MFRSGTVPATSARDEKIKKNDRQKNFVRRANPCEPASFHLCFWEENNAMFGLLLSVNSVILSHEIAHKQVLYSSTRVLYMSYSARQLTVVVLCSLLIPVRTNPVDIEKAGV